MIRNIQPLRTNNILWYMLGSDVPGKNAIQMINFQPLTIMMMEKIGSLPFS